jgi:hypothetical protein
MKRKAQQQQEKKESPKKAKTLNLSFSKDDEEKQCLTITQLPSYSTSLFLLIFSINFLIKLKEILSFIPSSS